MDLDRPMNGLYPPQHVDLVLKFLFIGDPGVGKTSLIQRYVRGNFELSYKPTIGADFSLKTIHWDNDTTLNILLWDLAGHERFGYMTRPYFKNAVGCAIVIDVTRRTTFHSLHKWLKELREKVVCDDGNNIPVLILANKCDAEDSLLNSHREELATFCLENNVDNWFETSAKEGKGVEEAMHYLIRKAVNIAKNQTTQGFELKSTKNKSKSCCL